MTKYRPITHTSLQDNNISLPIVGDVYPCKWTRNVFASLSMSTESFNPPSYWYNLSIDTAGSLYKLFLLEECVFLSIIIKCGLIHQKVVRSEMTTIIQ